jgi:hypothetical protein
MANLTKRTVDASTPAPKDFFIWCAGTPGFGVRVYPSGKKVFVAQVRVGRQTRRLRIGVYGPFTVDQARSQAQEIIRKAALGSDPQRERREARAAISVGELCETYMEAARAGLVLTRFRVPKRSSTVSIDEGRVRLHRINQIPLTYLMFLHQDDRALSAARAINGTIHYLRWHKGSAKILTRMKMREPSISSPLPFAAIGKKTAAE